SGGEGARVVDDGVAGQREQGGVQMVEAGVDQLEGDHGTFQEPFGLLVRGGLGTETGSGQDDVVEGDEVALPLVDVFGFAGLGVAGLAEPVEVSGALGGAFGAGEAGPVDPPVDDQAAVGGEDHVGQAFDGGDLADVVAQGAVEVAQMAPLFQGAVAVDGDGGVHP